MPHWRRETPAPAGTPVSAMMTFSRSDARQFFLYGNLGHGLESPSRLVEQPYLWLHHQRQRDARRVSHLLRASPGAQQTARPLRPQKTRDGGSIPGPVRHFWQVIRANAWRGSPQLSRGRPIANVLFSTGRASRPPDQ